MNAVYAYNKTNKRYTMEFMGCIYHFTYDFKNFSLVNSWTEDGKLIAKTYKGFRNRLGIANGSSKANDLMQTISQVKNIKVEN